MRKNRFILIFLIFTASICSFLYSQEKIIYKISITHDGIINPVAAEYVLKALQKSEKDNVQCLIIILDTPGGLLNSTREIVKGILNSKVPVVVYVTPRGARAASAGLFITLASNVAVMAPGTNIGAAHPVDLNGNDTWQKIKRTIEQDGNLQEEPAIDSKLKETPQETKNQDADKKSESYQPMQDKIMQDTLAWVRAICKTRSRNSEWPIKAVEASVSVTADEALKLKIIDFMADSETELLLKLNHYKIKMGEKDYVIITEGSVIRDFPMTLRQKILNSIAHPNLAYILMLLGFYGLLFEITHPSAIFPGVVGFICLVLALYSFQALPIDYAGVALVALAFILFLAEMWTASFGILLTGGIICLVLGSLMLFDSELPFFQLSMQVFLPVVALTIVAMGLLLILVFRNRMQKSITGKEGMLGATAIARTALNPKGKVFFKGEIWDAQSQELILIGEEVVIIELNGFCLKVKKKESKS